jgi:hypothetical protein
LCWRKRKVVDIKERKDMSDYGKREEKRNEEKEIKRF